MIDLAKLNSFTKNTWSILKFGVKDDDTIELINFGEFIFPEELILTKNCRLVEDNDNCVEIYTNEIFGDRSVDLFMGFDDDDLPYISLRKPDPSRTKITYKLFRLSGEDGYKYIVEKFWYNDTFAGLIDSIKGNIETLIKEGNDTRNRTRKLVQRNNRNSIHRK